MKVNAISLIVTMVFFMNVIVGVGNHFNEQLSEDLYSNLTNITYSGNISGYLYDNETLVEVSEQLKQNPTILAVGGTFDTFRNVFFGVPKLVYQIMGSAGYDDNLNTLVRVGLEAIMGVVYIILILQIISYLMGGGE